MPLTLSIRKVIVCKYEYVLSPEELVNEFSIA